MTLVAGLKGHQGAALASDSQSTHGQLREPSPKLFKTEYGIIWGSAGPYLGTQDLFTAMKSTGLPVNPSREEAKAAIREAMMTVRANLAAGEEEPAPFEALFAWYDAKDGRHYLLRCWGNGRVEFEPRYSSIGGVAAFGRFAFSRHEFLELDSLPIEVTKMVAHMVAEDVVRASAAGVDLPIQLAVVNEGEAQILRPAEVQAIGDTVGAFREAQRELLVPSELPGTGTPRKGIRPGEG